MGRLPAKSVVLVIEQHPLAASYLLQVLAGDPSISVFLPENLPNSGTRRLSPVVVLDSFELTLPLSECLRRLRDRFPQGRFLVLDRTASDEDGGRLLLLGIHGFLAHADVAGHLVPAVSALAAGRMWVPRGVWQAYIQASAVHRKAPAKCAAVTPRENQIMELARRRLSNKEIAEVLKIQQSTVKFHLSNIFSKMRASSRHDLFDKAEIGANWADFVVSLEANP